MKYYETSRFSKTVGSVGFYSIIAVCLVLIGAITWFAVSRYNKISEQSPTPQISETQNNESKVQDTKPEAKTEVESSPNSTTSSVQTQTSEQNIPYEEQAETVELILPMGKIIKNYSDSELQYSATYGDMRLHSGIDVQMALGSEVTASAKGTVGEISEDALLGKCITMEYSDNITVKYCGFDTLAVSEGEEVKAGRVIGTAGTVPGECADDSHIHIEVKKDGKTVEPFSVFKTE